ncbi:hypothetical protein GCM10023350_18370 [Nocardioides endophyticus]|uniref:Bacterial Ig-like domain-containing protein n=1 Tax=Nocardioides endophyticus TaxID=1353775 RepID=A0ABP8YQJ8_9ACTN
MTSSKAGRARRGFARFTATSLAVAGLAAVGATTAAPAEAADSFVSNATFTWGLNGYAQKGIFGPWTYKNLTGNASQLVGSVSGGTQNEYVVDPVPTTSMPVTTPANKTPNAVKFTAGTGTADPDTDKVDLSWTGSYTVNAYPALYGAPDEIYSDPKLTLNASGAGSLTMNFALGAGVDMEGNPTEAQNLGRVTLMTFSDGDVASTGADSFRATPDYQGVEVTVPGGAVQDRSCTTAGGATGWWGSWPQSFISVIPDSVRPHFYSTGCSGMQDSKPALPVDVDLGASATPTVEVSKTALLPNGQQAVTVTGSGFNPDAAIGTRPPFSGVPSGVYIAFGRYADTWRPSAGAPSGNRNNPAGANGNGVAVKWAVPQASFDASSPAQSPSSASYTILGTDGTFNTTIQVDQSWLADKTGNFGIYTYAGGGPTVAAYETYTPITFAKATPTVALTAPTTTYGEAATATATVASSGGTSGSATLYEGTTVLGTKDVVGGTAKFDLGTGLAAGQHNLRVAFAGNDNTNAGGATATLTIAKKATALTVESPNRSYGQASTATVTVSGTGVSGAVTLERAGKLVGSADLVDGKATFTLGKLDAGKHTLTATYAGNANAGPATGTVTTSVAKTTSTTTVKVTKKPTAKKAGTAKVTVKARNAGAADGSVKVVVRNGNGKVVAQIKAAKLKKGIVNVKLPKLAKGKYQLAVTFGGDGNVKGSSKTASLKVS